MRIPPSNIGWQSTAVIRWAIFWSGGKGTLDLPRKHHIVSSIFELMSLKFEPEMWGSPAFPWSWHCPENALEPKILLFRSRSRIDQGYLHLLPFKGEQRLLGVVESLQLRPRCRIIKHLGKIDCWLLEPCRGEWFKASYFAPIKRYPLSHLYLYGKRGAPKVPCSVPPSQRKILWRLW